jgi:hypothetical protein
VWNQIYGMVKEEQIRELEHRINTLENNSNRGRGAERIILWTVLGISIFLIGVGVIQFIAPSSTYK